MPNTLSKWGLGLLSLSFLFLVNCRGHYDFEKRIEWVASKLSSKLDLDETQKAKMEEIKKEILAKHKELKPNRGAWAKDLSAQIKSEKIDAKVLEKWASEREQKHTEMRKFLQSKLIEFHAILKPEQRETFAELVEKFASKHQPKEE